MFHAEAVLLINHYKHELMKLHAFLYQSVRSDDREIFPEAIC